MATLAERKAEYVNHKSEGEDFYNEFRSQLTLDVEAGTKTLEQIVEIQDKLWKVACFLMTGDWKSASRACGQVLPNASLDKATIDSLQSQINSYITTNYTW